MVQFSENVSWFADAVEVKGGNRRNPYQQIRSKKFTLLEFIEKLNSFPSGRSPNLGHILGMIFFQRPITFDNNQLSGLVSRWLHVVYDDHALERLSQPTSREINLTHENIEAIVLETSLQKYTPVGAPIRLAERPSLDDDVPEIALPEPLSFAWDQTAEFIAGSERLLIVEGMIGTGKRLLLQKAVSEARRLRRSCAVLAPNRRLAVISPL